MPSTRNRLRSALFVFLALGLALCAMAADRPAPALPLAASAADVCTPWLFDGCCPMFEKREKRTCTTSSGVSFTETRCVVTPECVEN